MAIKHDYRLKITCVVDNTYGPSFETDVLFADARERWLKKKK